MEPYFKPVTIFNGASMGGNLESDAVEIRNHDNIGISLGWETANAVGTFVVKVSADDNEDSVWHNTPLTASAASADDDAALELFGTPWNFVKVVYTRTSGTGTVTGKICGKDT